MSITGLNATFQLLSNWNNQ